MEGLLEEILEIPERAKECYERNKHAALPRRVPYLGMGSSYFAPLALYYAGADIHPEIASEYYRYVGRETLPLGVLISQSGESSETLWNLKKFEEVVAVTNDPKSTLGKAENARMVVELWSGKEEFFSSTKTYINTLVALYAGLGIDPKKAIAFISNHFGELKKESELFAAAVYEKIKDGSRKSFYVIGEGPNIATACEGALVLSETTKLAWIGMAASQFDHGPKEAAENGIVVFLNAGGKGVKRMDLIKKALSEKTNAYAVEFKEQEVSETLSPIPFAVRLFFFLNSLADHMKIEKTFRVGKKITTVPDSLK